MSNPSLDDLRGLSDEDVKLLYDIVTAAESSKAPPFRALFTAYERELGRRGISKDHDQIYLRFLLRMGENRKEGLGLYDQFEFLLSKLGFQVAFDGDEKEAEEQDPTAEQDEYPSPPRISLLQTQSFRPSRRVSFDSALENNTETKPLPVLPVRPRSTEGLPRLSSRYPQNRGDPLLDSTALGTSSRGGLRLLGPGLRHVPSSKHSYPVRNLDREPLELHETLSETSQSLSEYSDSAIRDVPAGRYPKEQATKVHNDVEDFSPLGNADDKKRQLETNARTLKYHHLAARAVLLFRRWSDSAKRLREDHLRMNDIALHYDTRILSQQAIDQWQMSLLEKRKSRETERFFAILEARATKARDLFLLTKSFTHWARCASEETLRRSAARRLILQTRYFNAWRDITVVNELKARRQCLSKFLSTWIKRTELVFDHDDRAVEFKVAKSTQYGYRQWFWAFCERRTPYWYMTNRKDTIFKKWLGFTRESVIRNTWALDFRNLELLRTCIAEWTRHSGLVLQYNHNAVAFRRRGLLGPTVESLRRELELSPLQSRISQSSDIRVARSALRTWNRKVNDIARSSRVNELRTMRNAWTAWNDSLRCQALSGVINDRIILQTLYKWVLAERLALCKKAKDADLRQSCFARWRGRSTNIAAALGRAKELALRSQQNRSALLYVKRWSILANSERQENTRAEIFHCEKLVSKSMDVWNSKTRHSAELDKRSEHARFFLLASRSIKKWRINTVVSKRNRRREAFTEFRKKTRSVLAKMLLDKWHGATKSRVELRARGRNFEAKRVFRIGTNLFESWRDRLAAVGSHMKQADVFWTEHTLQKHLQMSILRLRRVQESEARADIFVEGSLAVSAGSSLRKLNWRTFQLKRQHESADSLLRRNRRKHYRHMLRYWANIAARRQQLRQASIDGEETIDFEGDAAVPIGAFSQQWSPFRSRAPNRRTSQSTSRLDALRRTNASLTTPGYLKTPSRRTMAGYPRAHAPDLTQPKHVDSRSLAPLTPATTRITPFMNRLRAQYQTGKRGSILGSARRNNRTQFGPQGFEDIPESSSLDLGGETLMMASHEDL